MNIRSPMRLTRNDVPKRAIGEISQMRLPINGMGKVTNLFINIKTAKTFPLNAVLIL